MTAGTFLIWQVEAGIPEDDPRNPATIADLVGDNVGDCAGRGADLFESISAEIIGAMLLGGSLASARRLSDEVALSFMTFPLIIHSFDMLVSTVGVLSIKVKKSGNLVLTEGPGGAPAASDSSFNDLEGLSHEKSDLLEQYGGTAQNSASALEDPLAVLKRGYAVALALSSVVVVFASHQLLATEQHPDAWWRFACCGLIGLCNALTFLQLAQCVEITVDFVSRRGWLMTALLP